MQHVAACCSVLLTENSLTLTRSQRGAVWCNVVQCGAVWCSVLQCVAVQFRVVQCGAVHCSALQCGAVWCSVVQCDAVRCGALLQKNSLTFFFRSSTLTRLRAQLVSSLQLQVSFAEYRLFYRALWQFFEHWSFFSFCLSLSTHTHTWTPLFLRNTHHDVDSNTILLLHTLNHFLSVF